MLISPNGKHLFSHFPWIDRKRVEVTDTATLEPVRQVGIGKLLSGQFDAILGPAAPGYLWAIVRTSLRNRLPCLTIRELVPQLPEVFRLPFELDERLVDLPEEFFGTDERYFVGRYGGLWQTFVVTPEDSVVASFPCEWRGRNPRDKRQPAVSGIYRVPGKNEFWVTVDRSDHLIVVDSRTMEDLSAIRLPRQGARDILFSSDGRAYVQNFDTVAVVDVEKREVVFENRLQLPEWDDQGQKFAVFIGQMLLLPGEERLAIARPFSGDVVLVDVETLEKHRAIPFEGEPLELALHPNGQVLYVRDAWSGDVYQADLSR